jgi:hypothetical protein
MHSTFRLFVLFGLLVCTSVSGCAALIPDSIGPEIEHVSHASQHFGDHPTNFGYSQVNVVARWHYGNGYAEVSEGVTLGCERLDGMREVFNARFGYAIPLK